MRAPAFWYRRPGPSAFALAPLGWLYDRAGRIRMVCRPAWRAPVPVICVGNLVVGGAGKTPVALAIARELIVRERHPSFLTRGYGGRLAGPHLVDPQGDNAVETGDEPLLLARAAPCCVARDRVRGAETLVRSGADVVVMDDGFQIPALFKDLALIVVDGRMGFGNGRVIPAGPLRETVARGMARADALVIVGEDRHDVAALADGKPVVRATLRPGPEGAGLAGRRVLAFAGIGRPAKFFDTVREIGAEIVATAAFADHHPYTETELRRILADAEAAEAIALTTEKDAVRLPPVFRSRVQTLSVRCVWENLAALAPLFDRLFQPEERN